MADLHHIYANGSGVWTEGTGAVPANSGPVRMNYALTDFQSEGLDLEIAVFQRSALAGAPYTLSLKWMDTLNGDVVAEAKGLLIDDIEDSRSIVSSAMASGLFAQFEFASLAPDLSDLEDSAAFNALGTLGRNKVSLSVVADEPVVFDGQALYDALTLNDPSPDYLVLPSVGDLQAVTQVQRAADTLNCQAFFEAGPDLTVDQVIALSTSLDLRDHRNSLFWNPTLSRPRDAVSTFAPKAQRYALGTILGMYLLRNARVDSQGIPPLHEPVAGVRYPMPWRQSEVRPDVVLNPDALEQLAEAKVNVIRPVRYDIGVRVVVSDVLTQYDSGTSALRLIPAAEVETFTANGVIEIIKRWMLTRTTEFMQGCDREIRQFLDACVSAGMLQPAEDLDGLPYTLTLTPDQVRPFEAVHVAFARRPEGCVRTVFLTTTINK